MTSSTQILPTMNFPSLALAGSNTTPLSFTPTPTYSTADMLLRVAARRRFVRAVQALRRR
jgi:hypothetical protein